MSLEGLKKGPRRRGSEGGRSDGDHRWEEMEERQDFNHVDALRFLSVVVLFRGCFLGSLFKTHVVISHRFFTCPLLPSLGLWNLVFFLHLLTRYLRPLG